MYRNFSRSSLATPRYARACISFLTLLVRWLQVGSLYVTFYQRQNLHVISGIGNGGQYNRKIQGKNFNLKEQGHKSDKPR